MILVHIISQRKCLDMALFWDIGPFPQSSMLSIIIGKKKRVKLIGEEVFSSQISIKYPFLVRTKYLNEKLLQIN